MGKHKSELLWGQKEIRVQNFKWDRVAPIRSSSGHGSNDKHTWTVPALRAWRGRQAPRGLCLQWVGLHDH